MNLRYRKKYLLLGLLICGILAPLAAAQKAPSGIAPLQEPTTAQVLQKTQFSPFVAKDLAGNEVTETIFSPYTLTMINIWATFCPPCLKEMPDLAQLHEEYASKGVQIVGIVTDVQGPSSNTYARALQIIEATGANYLHLLPSEDLINLKLKQVQAVPETFFVDSKGTIVGMTYVGARSKGAWEAIIKSTLALVR